MLHHLYLGTCWVFSRRQRHVESGKRFITLEYFLFCITFPVSFENVTTSVLSVLSVSQKPHYYL